MKKGILSLFIVFCLVLVVGCGSTKSEAPDNSKPAETTKAMDTSKLPNVYKDKELGFSFHYPQNWDLIDDDPDIKVAILSPNENNNISSMNVVTDSAEPDLLRTSQNLFISQYKQIYDDFKLISAEKGKFAGEDCWIFSFTATEDKEKSHKRNYLFNHGKHFYSITFDAPEASFTKHDEIFNDIANSFVFK